ncbi:SDR family NAD(P)-dependent oxidoreductase, partial [Burkholderia ubonensis]
MNIDNRVFLVTGAGSGLGAAVARMVVEHGGRAMLVDVNGDAAAGVARELGA